MINQLDISSPKRSYKSLQGWEGFFPYYAGYPVSFAKRLLESANLPAGSVILDPWNGSGTTTFSASEIGLSSLGFDINPAMIIIARSRLLSPSEADSLEPIARKIVRGIRSEARVSDSKDPLLKWFDAPTTAIIRTIERRINRNLVGTRTVTSKGIELNQMSGLAATFYVALFSVCRQLVTPFRSSNPTWLRIPKSEEKLISAAKDDIMSKFLQQFSLMASTLSDIVEQRQVDFPAPKLFLKDTAALSLTKSSVDFVLTSPPYCTRIDYISATKIELAVLSYLIDLDGAELSRRMMGSTRVPVREIVLDAAWGTRCRDFLDRVRSHPSKASPTYYYKTHLDYFDKLNRSIKNISEAIKINGAAIFVVQDSYYKDVHNDLPKITCDFADAHGLLLEREVKFESKRTMSGINRYNKAYMKYSKPYEAVLCFRKTR